MPGKVNPVIPEVVLQVAGQVIGNDAAITFGASAGNFELNVMLPLMANNLLQSIQLLSEAVRVLAEKCIKGFQPMPKSVLPTSNRVSPWLQPLFLLWDTTRQQLWQKRLMSRRRQSEKSHLEESVLPAEEIHRILDDMIYGNPTH